MALHLAPRHPLAPVAANHCAAHTAPLIGGVACGACWEQAIRDDERFAVQHELPRQLQADPDLLDDVALSRASHGDPVHLTSAERREAVRRLRSSGLTITQIATRLRVSNTGVARELDKLEAQMAVAS